MLKRTKSRYHKVVEGQTIATIAAAFSVGEYALIQENGLQEEVQAGQVLRLPTCTGDRYTVKAGEDKTILCGSEENYEKKNGKHLYPGKRIVL